MKTKKESRFRIRKRIRNKIVGTLVRPRLSVYRSNRQIYAQLIDDLDGHTLVSVSSKDVDISLGAIPKCKKSIIVGRLLAQKAQKVGITSVVFDRSGYRYHGRVKSLADGAREGGLIF